MAKEGRRAGRSKFGWEFFGAELKNRRENAGLTQQELGDRAFCSGSYIGQFESAIRRPQLDLAVRFDEVLGADGFFERMWRELINKSPVAKHYAETAALMAVATRVSWYAPLLVPGLLQTEAYARAVIQAGRPYQTDEDTGEQVRDRIERGRLADDPTGPLLWAVLDEAVLRRPIGTDAVMGQQLHHIAEMVRKRRLVAQVLPFASRAHALLEGNLILMDFEDAPPVAYSEGPHAGQLLDEPALVARCQASYDLARAAALPPEASLALIQSVAEEYGDDH